MLTQQHQRPSAQLPSYWNWQRGQTGPESQEDPQINSWHSLLKALAQKHRCCFGTSCGKDHLPNCQLTETGKGVRNYQRIRKTHRSIPEIFCSKCLRHRQGCLFGTSRNYTNYTSLVLPEQLRHEVRKISSSRVVRVFSLVALWQISCEKDRSSLNIV